MTCNVDRYTKIHITIYASCPLTRVKKKTVCVEDATDPLKCTGKKPA